MTNIRATMQTNYNGWSVFVADDKGFEPDNVSEADQDLCETAMDSLPSITVDCYDDDGDCVGNPKRYEQRVLDKLKEVFGEGYTFAIDYDEWSS